MGSERLGDHDLVMRTLRLLRPVRYGAAYRLGGAGLHAFRVHRDYFASCCPNGLLSSSSVAITLGVVFESLGKLAKTTGGVRCG